jgi:hypothetical protein
MPAGQRLWKPGRQQGSKPSGVDLAIDWAHPLSYRLAHYYAFTEGGGIPHSLVRRGDAISLGAAASWAETAIGPALHFTQALTSWARLANTFTPTTSMVMTVELLARQTVANQANDFGYVFCSASAAGDGLMSVNTGLLKGWDIDSSTSDIPTGGSTTVVTLNLWYHVIFVCGGTAANASAIYTNNTLAVTGTLTGAFTTPMGWLGADGTNTLNSWGGDVALLAVWDRALNRGEVDTLFDDPYGLVIEGSEKGTVYAALGGVLAPVRPYPSRQLLGASASAIVSGAATFISNSTVAEAVQVVEPSGGAPTQSNSLMTEAVQVVEPSGGVPAQSNSLIVEAVQLRALATQQSNSLIGATVQQIVEPSGGAPEQSNSVLVETAVRIQEPTTEQSNSAAVETVGQLVAPALVQSNSLLNVTGGLASGFVQGVPTIQANSALAESAQILEGATSQANSAIAESVQVRTLATTQANSALVETAAQMVDAATEAANSAALETVGQVVDPSVPMASSSVLNVTGGIAGSTIVNGTATFAAASVLALTAARLVETSAPTESDSALAQPAQIVARGLVALSASLFAVTGSVFNPSAIIAGDVALLDTALHTVALTDSALHTVSIADVALAGDVIADTTLGTVTITDSALHTVALADSAP